MGEMPDWYPLLRAAKYLGVAPWDLLARPALWQDMAIQAQNAESQAEKQKMDQQNRKQRRGSGRR